MANAALAHEFVAPADQSQHRSGDVLRLADRRERQIGHPAKHLGLNVAHHEGIANQADGCGGREFWTAQSLDYEFGVAEQRARQSGEPGKEVMPERRSESAWRREHKSPHLRYGVFRSSVDRNGPAHAFAE